MKKFFFIAAIASAALVSCTKNEVTPVAEQEITFQAPVLYPTTKATDEVVNNYPTSNDFAVWAHYVADAEYTNFAEGQLYMNEKVVKYDGTSSWKTDGDQYYWPKNGSLTFIAYAPSSVAANAAVGASGITFSDYVVSNDATEQVDLLFSERAYNKTSVDDETIKPDVPTSPNAGGIHDPYTGVHISFKHALSSILFTARLSEAYTGTKITLKRIELTNVKSYGNFNQGLADNGTATTTADADLWTGENNAITYTVAADELLNTEKYYTCNDTRVAPVAADGKRTTDLILLPQVIADDAKMVITYTIQSPDSIALEQVLDIPLKNVVTEWKWGYRYIYNIIIGLDTIYFEPYVAPWTDYTPDLNPAF